MDEIRSLPNISHAELTVSSRGQRILTVYTVLSLDYDSPDKEQVRILRAHLERYLDPRRGVDWIEVRSVQPGTPKRLAISIHALDDRPA